MNIFYHTEDLNFNPKDWENTSNWLKEAIENEAKECGELNFIFCSDTYLLKINREYLNHDTYTDIITFDYVDGQLITGDIFISIDRVKENADLYQVEFEKELSRVLIHGILHLIGYNDDNEANTVEIRAKEDYYLSIKK